MKTFAWTCDRCGSENVSQEYYCYRTMNDNSETPDVPYLEAGEAYWCEDCDEDCSPIRANINPAHEDYQSER